MKEIPRLPFSSGVENYFSHLQGLIFPAISYGQDISAIE
jgi:hypothetical protein